MSMTSPPTPDDLTGLAERLAGEEWPSYMVGDGALKARLRATYARISHSIAADKAFVKERAAALEWCRANGNPHLALLSQTRKACDE